MKAIVQIDYGSPDVFELKEINMPVIWLFKKRRIPCYPTLNENYFPISTTLSILKERLMIKHHT